MAEQFEEILRKDLQQFLLSMKEVDERLRVGDGTSGMRLPECPDVEEKWESIAKAYIPDGIRECHITPNWLLIYVKDTDIKIISQ